MYVQTDLLDWLEMEKKHKKKNLATFFTWAIHKAGNVLQTAAGTFNLFG